MLLRLLMTTNRSRRMGNYKSISGPRATTYVLHASPPKNTEFEASTDMANTENDKSLFKESHKRLIYRDFNSNNQALVFLFFFTPDSFLLLASFFVFSIARAK